ncbi:hypothetical protein [Nocardiopsis ansamitocini]|nr:hypothetical protein [Nocardiopsis ansamitocini]
MAEAGIEPGQITTRAEMKDLFGGGPQGGIVPSTTTDTILIYSDHSTGHRYGYYDGWLAEEDEHGPIFEYTGAGTVGDQTFQGQKGSGNKAILHHDADDRVLRVFIAAGKVPGSGTKFQRYVGQFALDLQQPYVLRQAPDDTDTLRTVIVFRLRPTSDVKRNEKDAIPPAPATQVNLVPAEVTTSSMVEPENNKKIKGIRSAQPSTPTERREAALSNAYQKHLATNGHEVKRVQIRPEGLTSTLMTDLYDVTDHVLYEAKGTSTRKDIRMAIGQLLDYRRHVTPPNPRLAVLVPSEPDQDLQKLLIAENIALVYQDDVSFIGEIVP